MLFVTWISAFRDEVGQAIETVFCAFPNSASRTGPRAPRPIHT